MSTPPPPSGSPAATAATELRSRGMTQSLHTASAPGALPGLPAPEAIGVPSPKKRVQIVDDGPRGGRRPLAVDTGASLDDVAQQDCFSPSPRMTLKSETDTPKTGRRLLFDVIVETASSIALPDGPPGRVYVSMSITDVNGQHTDPEENHETEAVPAAAELEWLADNHVVLGHNFTLTSTNLKRHYMRVEVLWEPQQGGDVTLVGSFEMALTALPNPMSGGETLDAQYQLKGGLVKERADAFDAALAAKQAKPSAKPGKATLRLVCRLHKATATPKPSWSGRKLSPQSAAQPPAAAPPSIEDLIAHAHTVFSPDGDLARGSFDYRQGGTGATSTRRQRSLSLSGRDMTSSALNDHTLSALQPDSPTGRSRFITAPLESDNDGSGSDAGHQGAGAGAGAALAAEATAAGTGGVDNGTGRRRRTSSAAEMLGETGAVAGGGRSRRPSAMDILGGGALDDASARGRRNTLTERPKATMGATERMLGHLNRTFTNTVMLGTRRLERLEQLVKANPTKAGSPKALEMAQEVSKHVGGANVLIAECSLAVDSTSKKPGHLIRPEDLQTALSTTHFVMNSLITKFTHMAARMTAALKQHDMPLDELVPQHALEHVDDHMSIGIEAMDALAAFLQEKSFSSGASTVLFATRWKRKGLGGKKVMPMPLQTVPPTPSPTKAGAAAHSLADSP